jgi:hypothetical protein
MNQSFIGRDQDLKPSKDSTASARHPVSARWKDQATIRLVLYVPLASGVFLYLQVFVLPSTPRLASGDQAIYLHHATRLLEEQIIYRDYEHFTLPGTDATVREILAKVPNLQLVGRNGMHGYNNQDHAMLTAILAARNVAGARSDFWNLSVDKDYLEAGPQIGNEELSALGQSQPLVPKAI